MQLRLRSVAAGLSALISVAAGAGIAECAVASPAEVPDTSAVRQTSTRDDFVDGFLQALNHRRWQRVEAMIVPEWFESAIKTDRRHHGKFERAGLDYPCTGSECGIRSRSHEAYWMLTVSRRGDAWKIVDAYPSD